MFGSTVVRVVGSVVLGAVVVGGFASPAEAASDGALRDRGLSRVAVSGEAVQFYSSSRSIARRSRPVIPTPVPVPNPVPGGNDFTGWSAQEIRFFNDVNAYRAANGLKPVTTGSPCVHSQAVAVSAAMVAFRWSSSNASSFKSPYNNSACFSSSSGYNGGAFLSYASLGISFSGWSYKSVLLDSRVAYVAPSVGGDGARAAIVVVLKVY